MNTIHVPCLIEHVSDGHHTFGELYEHRHALFLALMGAYPELSWYSRKHDDGTEWPGWFIAGMETPMGTITYHLPITKWGLAEETGAIVLTKAMRWDGHTSQDVLLRIKSLPKKGA